MRLVFILIYRQFQAAHSTEFREGQGFVLVYSITSRGSFQQLEVFRQLMLKVKGPNLVFILVGNECDRISEREVSKIEGLQMARSFNCGFLETSAKTAYNVERLFTDLVRLLRSSHGIRSHSWPDVWEMIQTLPMDSGDLLPALELLTSAQNFSQQLQGDEMVCFINILDRVSS